MQLAWVAQGAYPVRVSVESETHTIFWCGFTSTRVGFTSSLPISSPTFLAWSTASFIAARVDSMCNATARALTTSSVSALILSASSPSTSMPSPTSSPWPPPRQSRFLALIVLNTLA